jgi:hypothetical protein
VSSLSSDSESVFSKNWEEGWWMGRGLEHGDAGNWERVTRVKGSRGEVGGGERERERKREREKEGKGERGKEGK